jgi:hypothetical protein
MRVLGVLGCDIRLEPSWLTDLSEDIMCIPRDDCLLELLRRSGRSSPTPELPCPDLDA